MAGRPVEADCCTEFFGVFVRQPLSLDERRL
jgi:hypothetical protein